MARPFPIIRRAGEGDAEWPGEATALCDAADKRDGRCGDIAKA